MPAARYPPLFGETPFSERYGYIGRPCVSHVVAKLHIERRLPRRGAILDVGCGRGTDLIALSSWGYRNLHGLDANSYDLAVARRRERARTGRSRIRWIHGTLRALAAERRGRFSTVIDTFLLSNFQPADEAAYFAEMARLTRPCGRLVLHTKVTPGWSEARDVPRPPPRDWIVEDMVEAAFPEGEDGLCEPALAVVHVLRRAD